MFSDRAAGPVWVNKDEIICLQAAVSLTISCLSHSSVFDSPNIDNPLSGAVKQYTSMTPNLFDLIWLHPRCLSGQSPGTPCLPCLVRVSPQVRAEPCRHPAYPACSKCLSACLCRNRGDPALPSHHLPVAAAFKKAAAAAAAEQDFLTATRLTLKAAVIAGHMQQAESCSRCLRGVAQVIFLLTCCHYWGKPAAVYATHWWLCNTLNMRSGSLGVGADVRLYTVSKVSLLGLSLSA